MKYGRKIKIRIGGPDWRRTLVARGKNFSAKLQIAFFLKAGAKLGTTQFILSRQLVYLEQRN